MGEPVEPPSTKISAPLTFDASSEARNNTVLATSSASPMRSEDGRLLRQRDTQLKPNPALKRRRVSA